MTDTAAHDSDSVARSVFGGLTPNPTEPVTPLDRSRLSRGIHATVPILLVGSMAAMTLNLTGPVDAASAKRLPKPKAAATDFGKTVREAMAAAATAVRETASAVTSAPPTTYRVIEGDTVSDIAIRYGLSTASVLALNGLGWSSTIFPGQELKLTSSGAVVPVAEAEATPSGRYTIVVGDTISDIADRFGVSTLSLLTANGLGWNSIIYPGQTLAIPGLIGPGTPPESSDPAASEPVATEPVAPEPELVAVVEAPLAATPPIAAVPIVEAPSAPASIASVDGLDAEMTANVVTIIQVGRELGVPDYGIIIAIATAMQESSLRNLDWGDRDSVGLFQQRPSSGWGSVEQLTTPSYAARLFYGGPSNPNRGYTRGLLDIPGWQNMPLTQAAQAVQISGYPDAYAKWETSARAWFAALG